MQQNVNPENQIDKSNQTNLSRNQKILKIKGKPFWLNISANKRKTYSRFKTQSPSTHFDDLLSDNLQSKQKHTQDEEQKYVAESVQSFNQNYDEDFQSYKSTINRQNHSVSRLPYFKGNKSQKKNINHQMSRLQISILNSPQKRQDGMIIKNKILESVRKIQKMNLKAQSNSKKQGSFSITKEIFMNQNTSYLRNQNQKIIRKIQQLRKIIPSIVKNQHELSQQQIQLSQVLVQLSQLREKIKRILSVQYEFQLYESKLEIKIHQKQVQHAIKQLLSTKSNKKPITVINDHTVVPPSRYSILREQLMNTIRLSCLRQEKNNQLSKKVQIYEEIVQKLTAKLRLQSFNSLQNRKSFLQWDFKRLKNEIDLRIIQQKVELQCLKDEIRLVDLKITQSTEIISKLAIPIDSQPKSQAKVVFQYQSKFQAQQLELQEQIQLIEQSNKVIENFVFKRKKINSFHPPTKNTSKKLNTNNSFIHQKQKKQQEQSSNFSILSNPSSTKKKVNIFDKSQSLKKKKELEQCNKNLHIRIKKSVFRHQDITEELEDLKL